METILFEGDLLELPEKQRGAQTEGIGELSNPLINTKEASDVIKAFLWVGGEIRDSSLWFSHHLEGFVFWIKDCFVFFKIIGHVKNIFKGRVGNPAVWVFESEPCIEFRQLRQKWGLNSRHKKPLEFEKTPLALFLWYLQDGVYYEFRGNHYLRIKRRHGVDKILRHIGISIGKSGDIDIFEKEQEWFFTYICGHGFIIPSCFQEKFPKEFIQYNKEWVSSHKPK